MSLQLAENKAADVQKMFDSSGREIPNYATFSIPFESVRQYVESTPAPKRPSRSQPIHESLSGELAAWDEASDEALESFDREFPPLEN